MELKGSKTEANLWEAFAGESQARNKYTYYASQARKDGFEQIAAFFEETAGNEKEHAKLWFKELGGIGTTAENLMAAAEGEHEEWTSMYKRMAEEAREEGFHRIADMFAAVGEIEKSHYERYLKLVENLENDEVFKKSSVKAVSYTHLQTTEFMRHLEELFAFLLPQYVEEGKSSLVIAVGCTGGHHRSVAVAHALTEFIRQKGYRVEETHRDISR